MKGECLSYLLVLFVGFRIVLVLLYRKNDSFLSRFKSLIDSFRTLEKKNEEKEVETDEGGEKEEEGQKEKEVEKSWWREEEREEEGERKGR